jgi:hypothetical protein
VQSRNHRLLFDSFGKRFNLDSAGEREVTSKEQTFRSDERSASEKAPAVSALRNDGKQMELRAGAKKDFETKQSSVFAAPGLLLAHFLTAECEFKG